MRAPGIKPEAIDKARQIVERQSRQMARLLDDPEEFGDWARKAQAVALALKKPRKRLR